MRNVNEFWTCWILAPSDRERECVLEPWSVVERGKAPNSAGRCCTAAEESAVRGQQTDLLAASLERTIVCRSTVGWPRAGRWTGVDNLSAAGTSFGTAADPAGTSGVVRAERSSAEGCKVASCTAAGCLVGIDWDQFERTVGGCRSSSDVVASLSTARSCIAVARHRVAAVPPYKVRCRYPERAGFHL